MVSRGDADAGAGEAAMPGAGAAHAAEHVPGGRILSVNRWTTGLFVLVSVLAAAVPEPFEVIAVPVDLAMFVLGCVAFLWAYTVAIGRSRYDEVSVGGAFFLAGDVAPPAVARELRVVLAIQVVVAVAAAAVRPFTAVAFAVLAPMAGLGLMAWWGARHGRFPARRPPDEAPPPAQ
jgi:hypothetical protein